MNDRLSNEESRQGSRSVGDTEDPRSRKMVKTELFGRHSFAYGDGHHAHVWNRDGKYLLRGRLNGHAFGETLGRDESAAERRLQQIMVELEEGTYRPPRHPSRKQKSRPVPTVQTINDIVAAYITERRRLRGKRTAQRYCDHLMHVLAFAAQSEIHGRYPHARDIDREFTIALREFLLCREVRPNGREGTTPRRMAARSVVDILQRFRAALRFACRLDVGLLPPDFVIPLDDDIVGKTPPKDPIRSVALTMDQRIRLVRCMDLWQFTHLTPFLMLPSRPGELAGLLVNEIEWDYQYMEFGTRFGGSDFTKGRQSFMLPFPDQLRPIFCGAIGEREAGPVFVSRAVFEGTRRPKLNPTSFEAFDEAIEKSLYKAKATTAQDAKVIVRGVIRSAGGVDPDDLNRELKQLVTAAGIEAKITLYRCREIVTTEFERVNMSMLARRYLTAHSTKDILNEYTAFGPDDLRSALEPYWERVSPLLSVIAEKAVGLELKCRGDVA